MIDKQVKMAGNHTKGGNEKQHMTHECKTEAQTETENEMRKKQHKWKRVLKHSIPQES